MRGSKPDRHPQICQEGVDIVSDAEGKVSCLKHQKWLQHCLPLTVLTRMCSCPLTTCDLAAKTTAWSNHKKPWCMPRHYSIRLRRPNHQHQANHASWQSVCGNWGETMEPLMLFTDATVFGDDVPLHWVKITSSRTFEPVEPTTSWQQSCSQNRRAHTLGSFMAAHNVGRSKPVTTTQMASTSLVPPCKWKVPPGFAEITKFLQGMTHHMYQ